MTCLVAGVIAVIAVSLRSRYTADHVTRIAYWIMIGAAAALCMAYHRQMSQEVTRATMTIKTMFDKQIFVRLTEDNAAFVCTTKWPLLSRTRRVGLDEAVRDFAPPVDEAGSIVPEEFPVLVRRRAVEPAVRAEET